MILTEIEIDPSLITPRLFKYIPNVQEFEPKQSTKTIVGVITTEEVRSGDELLIDYTDTYKVMRDECPDWLTSSIEQHNVLTIGECNFEGNLAWRLFENKSQSDNVVNTSRIIPSSEEAVRRSIKEKLDKVKKLE